MANLYILQKKFPLQKNPIFMYILFISHRVTESPRPQSFFMIELLICIQSEVTELLSFITSPCSPQLREVNFLQLIYRGKDEHKDRHHRHGGSHTIRVRSRNTLAGITG